LFEISYEIIHPTSTQNLVILHGWGSNKEIMKQAFGNKLPQFKHIYIDMPGFGKSSNPLILTTHDYANIIQQFLDALHLRADAIIGHSFGGKVATLLNPPTLILLSSSGILVPKPLLVRVKIALFKLLKPFGLAKMRHFFVSDDAKDMPQNMYETFKNVVDEDFEASFSASKSTALLFWGKQDTATPLWTAEKIDKLIEKSTLYPLDGDHYFFLKHADFIANEIETKTRG
ncbi:MAG: alpha/beta hydrolase, partial [Epsilonproteobacteria bacterium]|nr:alpha/beta hydrolase [Campylobacterota bacterium]